MSYAPPSHAPPSSSSSSSRGYAPTTTPTPGQPLLLKGKMLIYPNGWQGCPKCQDTGYKHGDPSNPCRRCWDTFSQKPNPLLISSAGMQGAKVLQKPLPGGHSYGPVPMGGSLGGNSGHPGIRPDLQRPLSTGSSFQSPYTMGHYAPPAHAPPPELPQRRGPPQVNRAEDANETLDDENGEAPPAYDDAVAAGPDGILPPQRRNSNGHLVAIPTGNSNGSTANIIPPQQTEQSTGSTYPSPSPQPNTNFNNYAAPYQQYQPMYPHHQPSMSPGWHPQQAPMAPFFHPPPAQVMSYGHRAPPGALVVRPGDPRLGGQLCYKCGGAGVRKSLWWGDETCNRCGGSGRTF